jgi:hypothetical protein
MNREPYTYVVLRYRHDPLAGEAVNVGVVLHAPTSRFLGARFRRTYGRISRVFPDLEGSALRRDLAAIEHAFARLSRKEGDDLFFESHNAATLAHRVIGKDDGSLIWSELGSGISSSPTKTLDDLFSRFVSRYDDTSRYRRSDADVWRPFRDRLLEREIGEIFERKRFRSPLDEVEFEHAWKNGKWHCFQPLSFDLANVDSIQEKAARWVGHMVGLSNASDPFQPYFIVGKPSDEKLMGAYERAVDFISEAPLDPRIVRETELDQLADTIADWVVADGTP